MRPVVCINSFHTDTAPEVALVRRIAEQHGALAALSQHWLQGGEGALELAEAVEAACAEPREFHYLYGLDLPFTQRIETIAREVYGAAGVSYSDQAAAKLSACQADPDTRGMGVCMVKTHLSLSHNPDLKGRPSGWTLPIRDVLVYRGAGFVVPVAGDIKLMPGTGSDPAFRRIDVEVETGRVKGLF